MVERNYSVEHLESLGNLPGYFAPGGVFIQTEIAAVSLRDKVGRLDAPALDSELEEGSAKIDITDMMPDFDPSRKDVRSSHAEVLRMMPTMVAENRGLDNIPRSNTQRRAEEAVANYLFDARDRTMYANNTRS